MKKYRATTLRLSTPSISSVTVEGETDKFVIIDGRRTAKRSTYDNYFDTYEDAWKWMYEMAASRVKIAKRALESSEAWLYAVSEIGP